MNFNSLDFAIFLPLVFAMYWKMSKMHLRFQNLFILLASFVFYGWVDVRFLGLIIFSILLDYFMGVYIDRTENHSLRRYYLTLSILGNLTMLGYFKYYNFFVDSIADVVSILGVHPRVEHLQIILPVGISFYTFQTMSYTIDIYRRKMRATKDIIAFGAFVSFFPQLVAGPIERAEMLLPQFLSNRKFQFNQAVSGLRQILWGLFKKVVIADSCGHILDPIYANYSAESGSMLAIAAFLFAVQLYCDFSGYSDIAIGTARLFGIRLSTNFRYPFFSLNVRDFWNRWHISLSTWFRDYLYFPLGGSRLGTARTVLNIVIVFVVSGLWHGASWNFVVWGLVCAFFMVAHYLWPFRSLGDNVITKLCLMTFTFLTFMVSLVFFRSEDLTMSMDILDKIFSSSLLTYAPILGDSFAQKVFGLIAFCFLLEWYQQHQDFALAQVGLNWPRWIRYGFYYILIMLIFLFDGQSVDFIYFRF